MFFSISLSVNAVPMSPVSMFRNRKANTAWGPVLLVWCLCACLLSSSDCFQLRQHWYLFRRFAGCFCNKDHATKDLSLNDRAPSFCRCGLRAGSPSLAGPICVCSNSQLTFGWLGLQFGVLCQLCLVSPEIQHRGNYCMLDTLPWSVWHPQIALPWRRHEFTWSECL